MIEYTEKVPRNLKFEGETMINLAKRILVTIDNKIEFVIAKALKLPVDVNIHSGQRLEELMEAEMYKNPEFEAIIKKMRGKR